MVDAKSVTNPACIDGYTCVLGFRIATVPGIDPTIIPSSNKAIYADKCLAHVVAVVFPVLKFPITNHLVSRCFATAERSASQHLAFRSRCELMLDFLGYEMKLLDAASHAVR